jgi:hypothetical protein
VIRSLGDKISTLTGTTGGVLSAPRGIWGDSVGNLFIADSDGHHQIKQLSLSNQNLTTIAGTGGYSSTGEGVSPTSATFMYISSIWGDSNGQFLLIAEYTANKIRIIDKSLNLIYTAAGTGASSSGRDRLPATSTDIYEPYGVWGNTAGNIFISELKGTKARQLILPSISSFSALPPSYLVTVAGDGTGSTSGDGGTATSAAINGPIAVWQDTMGTLFILEHYGNRVRAVLSSGIISTIAGTGAYSFSGDNGPVRQLLFYFFYLSLFLYLGIVRHFEESH